MGYDYDKLYRTTPQALGAPTRVIVAFFERQGGSPLRVLDVGCGQGRDALCLGRMGHSLVGVDIAPSGIAQMLAAARDEGVSVEGIVADLAAFEPEGLFDVVLCDRTLHMLPKRKRLAVLDRLMGAVREGGWVLIVDERANIPAFRDVAAGRAEDWKTERDKGGLLFLRRP